MSEPTPADDPRRFPSQYVTVYCPKCRKELRVYVRDIAQVSSATCCGETIYVSIND